MKHIAKQLRDLADQIESNSQHHAPETSKLIHKHFGKIIGEKFDRNCRKYDKINDIDGLDYAFDWERAPERYDFWLDISNMISENNLT